VCRYRVGCVCKADLGRRPTASVEAALWEGGGVSFVNAPKLFPIAEGCGARRAKVAELSGAKTGAQRR